SKGALEKDLSIGEKFAHLRFAEDGGLVDHLGPSGERLSPPLHEVLADLGRKLEEEGHAGMRLDGEARARRLHPVGGCEAAHFTGKGAAAFGVADMLDHGVAEDDIERLIVEDVT